MSTSCAGGAPRRDPASKKRTHPNFLSNGVNPDLLVKKTNDPGEWKHIRMICFAVKVGSLEMVEDFVKAGAEVKKNAANYTVRYNTEALSEAIDKEHDAITAYLLEKGSEPNNMDKPDFLAKACSKGNTKIANSLIKHGASVSNAISMLCKKYKEKQNISDSCTKNTEATFLCYSQEDRKYIENAPLKQKNAINMLLNLNVEIEFEQLHLLKNLCVEGFNFKHVKKQGQPVTEEDFLNINCKNVSKAFFA